MSDEDCSVVTWPSPLYGASIELKRARFSVVEDSAGVRAKSCCTGIGSYSSCVGLLEDSIVGESLICKSIASFFCAIVSFSSGTLLLIKLLSSFDRLLVTVAL